MMGEVKKYYSREEIAQAKETSLSTLMRSYGCILKRVGSQFVWDEDSGHDSFTIFNDRTFFIFREGFRGTQIDFLQRYQSMSFLEAVQYLLDFQGYGSIQYDNHKSLKNVATESKLNNNDKYDEFALPEKVQGGYRKCYSYLMKKRGLSIGVINYFVNELKILYEENKYHNLVFLGKDKEGNVKYAMKRGTYDLNGKKFKGDVYGSNKDFNVNIVNLKSSCLKVFEASIDLMSYLDLTGDYTSNKIVLGTNSDKSLIRFLHDYTHIKEIDFCLDNDIWSKNKLYGEEAEVDQETGEIIKERKIGLIEKYELQGFITTAELVEENIGCKDYNDYLLYLADNDPSKVWAKRKSNNQKRCI